jgi:hypothetical protein
MDTIRDERGFKFGKLPTQVRHSKKIGSDAKVVYAELDDRAKNGVCFPGQKRMSFDLGISIFKVNRGVKQLQKEKFISINKKTGHNGWRNEYVLLRLQ